MNTLLEFIANDKQFTGDHDVYLMLAATLEGELRPEGILEICYSAQILRTMWHLQAVEARADHPNADKLRIGFNSLLKQVTGELRRLQSERQIRAQLESELTGLASTKELVQTARAVAKHSPSRKNEPNSAEIRDMEARIQAHLIRTDTAGAEDLKKRSQFELSVGPRAAADSLSKAEVPRGQSRT